MLIDSVRLFDGAIERGVIEKGHVFPLEAESKEAQLFYLSENLGAKTKGLYVFDGVVWKSTSGGGSSGGGEGGAGNTLSEPDSIDYVYNDDGDVISVTETYGENIKTYAYTYNDEGNVYKVDSTYLGVTRTEIYTFDSDDNAVNMTATTS